MAWSTERKNRARDNAARIGQAQLAVEKFVSRPSVQVVGYYAFCIITLQAVDNIRL